MVWGRRKLTSEIDLVQIDYLSNEFKFRHNPCQVLRFFELVRKQQSQQQQQFRFFFFLQKREKIIIMTILFI